MKLILPLFTLVFFILIWEATRILFDVPRILLPPVGDVLASLRSQQDLHVHIGITVKESAVGFFIGNAAALLLSVAMVRFRPVERSLMPYAIALKTTPVAAVAPILMLWFGGDWHSKAAAAATVCFFPTLVNCVRGLRLVDGEDYRDFVELFQSWESSWPTTLLHLRFPFALPFIFSAFKISASLSLVGAIVAEFIAADRGVGYLIVIYSRRLETAKMFAVILVSTLIGVGFYYLIVIAEHLILRRRRYMDRDNI